MKKAIKKAMTLFLALFVALTMLPAQALAYVGAVREDNVIQPQVGFVAAPGAPQYIGGQQVGYYYIKNPYIGFYIRPDGTLTTVPSQKNLEEVAAMGATEINTFYPQYAYTGHDEVASPWVTNWDVSAAPLPTHLSPPVMDAVKGTLTQTVSYTNPNYGATTLEITYALARLDRGSTQGEGSTGRYIDYDSSNDASNWGVKATAVATHSHHVPGAMNLLWKTEHFNAGGVGHDLRGNLFLSNETWRLGESGDTIVPTPLAASVSDWMPNGIDRYVTVPTVNNSFVVLTGTEQAKEVYTDSFPGYANQFVALGIYDGITYAIRGHGQNYGNAYKYDKDKGVLSVQHELVPYSATTGISHPRTSAQAGRCGASATFCAKMNPTSLRIRQRYRHTRPAWASSKTATVFPRRRGITRPCCGRYTATS
jgi:hypothetical protein